jgi:heme exporter protein A
MRAVPLRDDDAGFDPLTQPILQVQSLGLQRGERRLFRNLDFTLEAGGLAIVRGPNGAGKSTLLRALAGLTMPADGSARVFGVAPRRLAGQDRGRLLYLGHAEGLKQDLSVGENLAFWASLDRGRALTPTELDRVLAQVDLAAAGDQLVRHLSAGQRRRTVLARMVSSPAELWLLDEPLTNLDQPGRALVQQWLQAHLDQGGAAVVATHTGFDTEARGRVEIQL